MTGQIVDEPRRQRRDVELELDTVTALTAAARLSRSVGFFTVHSSTGREDWGPRITYQHGLAL
jgi:hypothetical protein